MKLIKKHTQNIIWDHIKNCQPNTTNPRMTNGTPKFIVYLIIFIVATCIVNPFKLIKTYDPRYNILNFPSEQDSIVRNSGEKIEDITIASLIVKPQETEMKHIVSDLPSRSNQNSIVKHSGAEMENVEVATLIFKPHKTEVKHIVSHLPVREKSELKHIVFGIASTSKLWEHRKNYIKLWWNKTSNMRGFVWLDKPMKAPFDKDLPKVRISGDTSLFSYNNKLGDRSAIRISRIVSETVRMKMDNVRWIVMGDDDTVFITENLIRVLNKYDHNQFYYIGSSSESHLQNIVFSYGMAYGGGGIAISYPLAVAMEKMQDKCIQRYPGLYGSDDRLQACMAELGVPLTKEIGFHQYDVYGSLFGLLSAHPVTPLVSLHHLDLVEPIFPATTRIKALKRLMLPMKLDSAGLIQQSICYEKSKGWTISISWGYSIQIFRGIMLPRELEKPSRTFLNWYQEADYTGYPFNTRPFGGSPCHNPVKFYLNKVRLNSLKNQTVSEYRQHRVAHSTCKWKMSDPSKVESVIVYKKLDPQLWDRSPRRNCCRVLDSKNNRLVVYVGVCKEDETTEV